MAANQANANVAAGAQPAAPVNVMIGALNMDRFMDEIDRSFGLLMLAGANMPDLMKFIENAKFRSVSMEKCTVKFLRALAARYGGRAGDMLMQAIIIAVCFGINTVRTDRMTDELKAVVADITSATGIKKGTGVEKEDQMTWQRLLLAFPYSRGVFQELGIVQPIGSVPTGLPTFYAQQGGPSMASDALWDDENFLSLFKKWMVSNSKQLNRRNKNARGKPEDIEEDQMGYASVQHSNPYSEKARPGWWAGAAILRAILMVNQSVGVTLQTFRTVLGTNTAINPELFTGPSVEGLWREANENAVDAGVIAQMPNQNNP